MTALNKFEKLECPGVWRESNAAQRLNVYVSLGEATLIIKDANDSALAHWSLPAVARRNPGEMPAIYTPGGDAEEELEIDDDTMIDAIRTVQQAVNRTRPRRGRLRRVIFAVSLVALIGLGVLWLPGALVRHTAQVLPETLRQEVGQRLLQDLAPFTGKACTGASGTRVLAQLQKRVLGTAPWNVVVVPDGPTATANLPGGMILLRKDLVEDAPSPSAAAGGIVLESARALHEDPLVSLLRAAGPAVTLRLLTQGEIDDAVLKSAARTYLVAAPVTVPAADLEERFRTAAVNPEAISGHASFDIPDSAQDILITPLLSDGAWLRLTEICGNPG